jgi:putative PIN family toxin of toxin-antitoxin system
MSRSFKPLKVVFDCMIFLQATANENSPAASALDLLDTGEIKLYISEPILEEVRKVLNRTEVRTALPGITDVRVEALFRRLDKKAVMVKLVPRVFEYSRDPKDESYLNLAAVTRATYLVSWDKDLLGLMMGYDSECKQFRQRFRFLRVIEPVSFLKEVERAREKKQS